MEKLISSYKILFNLEFELTGNSNDLNQYFTLIPDQRTLDLYTVYKILPRFQKNSKTMLVQVVSAGADKDKLRVMLTPNEVLRFEMKFAGNEFMNATNLSTYNLQDNVIYLTNEINHVAGSALLLSAPVEAYDPLNEYEKGYVVQASGSFFKAIKPSSNADQHPTTETDYWKSIADGGTYVSQADLRDRSSLSTTIDLDTVMLIEINYSTVVNATYQLLDATSKCREVTYKIKLLSGN